MYSRGKSKEVEFLDSEIELVEKEISKHRENLYSAERLCTEIRILRSIAQFKEFSKGNV